MRITKQALAGSTVGIECMSGEKDSPRLTPGVFDACKQIAHMMKDLGANVLAPEGLLPEAPAEAAPEAEATTAAAASKPAEAAPPPKADFTVRYVDRGGRRDYGGWTAPLFLLTFSFFPDVEDISVSADVEILDGAGLLAARYPLKLDLVKIYGVAALYYMGTEFLPGHGKERSRELKASLAQYVDNIVYTYKQRQQITSNATPARAP